MFARRTHWNLGANRLSQALQRHRASARPLLDLTASNPTECGFIYDSRTIMRALCSPSAVQYRPDPRGLESARAAVAEYYAQRGQQISLGDIVLTTSTSEAYSFIFRLLCDPGDELLIPTPSYPLFDFLADIQDVQLTRYPLFYDHGWHIDLHALEQAITPRTRGIILVHPNNPTGHFTGAAEAAALSGICSARQMAMIADEVFLDFGLQITSPIGFSTLSGALTFTLSGLSKIAGLPQMKLAWLIASGPEELKKESLSRLEMIADTYFSLCTPIQLAAPVLLEQRHGFQEQWKKRAHENLAEMDRQLSNQKNCSRLEIEGGWYSVLRIPATRSDEDLAIELLETRDVYVHPGHFYDFPGDGHLIVSLIAPERQFAEGLARVLSMLQSQ